MDSFHERLAWRKLPVVGARLGAEQWIRFMDGGGELLYCDAGTGCHLADRAERRAGDAQPELSLEQTHRCDLVPAVGGTRRCRNLARRLVQPVRDRRGVGQSRQRVSRSGEADPECSCGNYFRQPSDVPVGGWRMLVVVAAMGSGWVRTVVGTACIQHPLHGRNLVPDFREPRQHDGGGYLDNQRQPTHTGRFAVRVA